MARRLKDFRVQLGVVALVGLVVRVTAVLGTYRYLEPEGDQNFYWRQGQDLAHGYGFVYRNSFGERVATAVHPPLHSAYLGVVSVFGGTSHAWHRMASTLLGTAAVVIIGLAARRIAGNRAGLIAAGLAATYPNLWVNDAMMLSESMYALTIGAVVLLAYRFRDALTTRNAVMLGGAVALAALTRAEAAFLFVLLVVPLVLFARDHTWRTRALRGGTALAAGVLVLAPWVVRNYLTFDSHPLTISNGSGFVVEISNCDQTYGLAAPTDGKGNPSPDAADDKLLGYWAPECDRTPWPPGDETVVAAAKQQAGVDYIASHKSLFPKVVAARIGRIWDIWRPGQSYDFNVFFERRGVFATRSGMIMYYPLLVASLAALFVLRKRRQMLVPFVAIIVMTTRTAAVSFGITRYRVGADVAFTVLAAVAIDALLTRFGTRRRGTASIDEAARGSGTNPSPNETSPRDVPVGPGAPADGATPSAPTVPLVTTAATRGRRTP